MRQIFPAGKVTSKEEFRLKHRSISNLESRIEFLENEADELIKDKISVKETSMQNANEARSLVKGIEEKFGNEQEELKEQVDDAVVGGKNLEWLGIIYLLAGIIFSTAALEITEFIGHDVQ